MKSCSAKASPTAAYGLPGDHPWHSPSKSAYQAAQVYHVDLMLGNLPSTANETVQFPVGASFSSIGI